MDQVLSDSTCNMSKDTIPPSANTEIPNINKCKPLQTPLGGKVVVLNGFPGTGKLTILKKVKELLPANTTCLLDNHLLIDPVVAVIPSRSDEHYELRRLIRAPIFEKLAQHAKEGYIILMTACLAEDNERDAMLLQEHLNIIRGTDVPIFWINTYCEQTALETRIRSPERYQGAKTKLTDVPTLRDLLRDNSLIEPHKQADELMRLFVRSLDASGPVELSVSRLMSIIAEMSDRTANQTTVIRKVRDLKG